ncbi:MAG TPA: CDP-glycerol glycerophosphotransferase family protein [Chlamydiales bacterium]|nr:CDP-glycerol glycerophosphotransferase family protein [Chlamydiales bacterium]
MRCAAFNTGSDIHLLDHIAPLAELLQMPLITTETLNHELACRYYPQVEVRHMPDLEFKLSTIAEQFDTLFECKYWAPHLKSLFQQLYNKKMQLVFCPHGQSDKGYQTPLLAPYAQQDAVLICGKLMIQMLKDLSIWPSISNYALIGNYRLQFYQKHQSFYDNLVEKTFPLSSKNRTLLYAPTWRDADASTSFFDHAPKVLSQLPSDWNLLLKLHPLLEQRDPSHFYSIAALADKKPNVHLIHEFPPVYPLLSRADIYLGDASSVGYDFLFFQRPLYFFPTTHPGRLHSCGQFIDPSKNIYSQLEKSNLYKEKQRALYQLAYSALSEGRMKRVCRSFR